MQNKNFHLKVASREGIVYEADAKSVSSYNEDGKFDVLPSHANFISLIQKGITIIDTENMKKEIRLNNALMKVYQNNVEIYMGIEWLFAEDKGTTQFPNT